MQKNYRVIKRTAVNDACPKCGATESQFVDVVYRMRHFIFIPLMPYDKKLIRKCDVCGATSDVAPTKENEQLLKKTSYPILNYMGLIFVILIIAGNSLAYIAMQVRKSDNIVEFLDNPKAGYVIIEKNGDYTTTAMVVKVSNDTLFVRRNTKEVKGEAYLISDESYYSDEMLFCTIDRLRKMDKDGRIIDIVPEAYLRIQSVQNME